MIGLTPIGAVAGVLFIAGSFFVLVGAVGLVRMPDFYTRAHAASVTDTLGAGLLLLAMVVLSLDASWIVTVKLLMIGGFMFVTGPTAGHALVRAAFEGGPAPVLDELEQERSKRR